MFRGVGVRIPGGRGRRAFGSTRGRSRPPLNRSARGPEARGVGLSGRRPSPGRGRPARRPAGGACGAGATSGAGRPAGDHSHQEWFGSWLRCTCDWPFLCRARPFAALGPMAGGRQLDIRPLGVDGGRRWVGGEVFGTPLVAACTGRNRAEKWLQSRAGELLMPLGPGSAGRRSGARCGMPSSAQKLGKLVRHGCLRAGWEIPMLFGGSEEVGTPWAETHAAREGREQRGARDPPPHSMRGRREPTGHAAKTQTRRPRWAAARLLPRRGARCLPLRAKASGDPRALPPSPVRGLNGCCLSICSASGVYASVSNRGSHTEGGQQPGVRIL